MQLVFYLSTFSTPCMSHLLYLIFRCDGKFGRVGGTKHSHGVIDLPLHDKNGQPDTIEAKKNLTNRGCRLPLHTPVIYIKNDVMKNNVRNGVITVTETAGRGQE